MELEPLDNTIRKIFIKQQIIFHKKIIRSVTKKKVFDERPGGVIVL